VHPSKPIFLSHPLNGVLPEIFEVLIHEIISSHAFIQITALVELGESIIARTEALGVHHSVPQPTSTLISLQFRQLRFVNSAHQIFAMSSRVPHVRASTM
jgi:hypothetical protein